MLFNKDKLIANACVKGTKDYNKEKLKVSYDETSVFRLRLLHFGTIGYGYNIKEIVDWPHSPFLLPENMSVQEGFLILSYLVRKIEQDLRLPKCAPRAVTILNENLTKYHFRISSNYNNIVDLITATGDMKRFKRSEYYTTYFDWFTEGVTFERVKAIYEKYAYDFEEPRFDTLYKVFP